MALGITYWIPMGSLISDEDQVIRLNKQILLELILSKDNC